MKLHQIPAITITPTERDSSALTKRLVADSFMVGGRRGGIVSLQSNTDVHKEEKAMIPTQDQVKKALVGTMQSDFLPGNSTLDEEIVQELSQEQAVLWIKYSDNEPSLADTMEKHSKIVLSIDSLGNGTYLYLVYGDLVVHSEDDEMPGNKATTALCPVFFISIEVKETFHQEFFFKMKQMERWTLCLETSTLCFFRVEADTGEIIDSFEAIHQPDTLH